MRRKSPRATSTKRGLVIIDPSSRPSFCHSANDLPPQKKKLLALPTVPPTVVPRNHFRPIPRSCYCRSLRRPMDDVVLEGEREMFLCTRQLDLVLLRVDEDVVADNVLLAVIATLVIIQPPTAVRVAVNVVEDITQDHSALGFSEHVNTSHVAHQSLTEVVNMVVGDEVTLVGCLTVAQPPTNRDAGVKQIRNLVVGDAVVTTLTNPYTDSARKNTPSLSDNAVVYNSF